jgi:hypothetical protein
MGIEMPMWPGSVTGFYIDICWVELQEKGLLSSLEGTILLVKAFSTFILTFHLFLLLPAWNTNVMSEL